jgi:hypothetical protein
MVFDNARQRTLLFGGRLGDAELAGDTWEWDGHNWIQVSDIGPKGRYRHKMADDSTRERIILFGGRVTTTGASTSETWEWDGAEWVQLSDTGPALENGSTAMVYDKTRERVVLFGSGPSLERSETWEWDGEEWTQQGDVGPPARFHTAMAYDGTRSRTVLFGGSPVNDATKVLGDTWEWTGANWTQQADFGPDPRSEHALAFDDSRNRVVLFGGRTQKPGPAGGVAPVYLADTWEWDGSRWLQRQNMGPQPRINHALSYDLGRKRAILFGGAMGADFLGDTWEFGERPSR